MDMRRLRYFIAVAEELHFTRAAQRLHVSQPPLSKQIKELELELGVELLRRTQRSVELTAAGEILLEGGRRILGETRELEERVGRAGRGEVGHLSVGFIPSAGFGLLPPVVRRFREERPQIALRLREQSEAEQIAEFAQRGIDVGFARTGQDDPALDSLTILSEPLVVAFPKGHPLSHDKRPDLGALRDELFVNFPKARAPALHDLIMKSCAASGFVPKTAQEANAIYTCLGLVGAGVGLAILPASTMEVRTEQVTFRLPRQTGLEATMSMRWRRASSSPVLMHFLSVCRTMAADYQARQSVLIAAMAD